MPCPRSHSAYEEELGLPHGLSYQALHLSSPLMSKGGRMHGDVTEASLWMGDHFDFGPTEVTPEFSHQ